MLSALTRWLFKVWGWQVVGPVPTVPKAIWVEAPHTTNWDFLVGLGVRPTIRLWIHYFAKSSLFTWYAGWLFRVLGGIPVYRDKSHNLVDAMAKVFEQHDQLHICIAPEGTRSNVQTLKTGFYHIARKADVPLILVSFNWHRRRVVLSEPLYLTGNYAADMLPFYTFFSQVSDVKKAWLSHWEETGEIR
ncbi:1-acyl-sn-glycerol-3-phosphate acyltransferase [Fibrella aquatilis]|uniref:1-acyl-sn-glycerol-3-phosphate acyltransferase n=1 Tax=Fibrella aquatilis TaxID=2817059 RepID=A0A939JW43_9BACT|nr:1-acyl-sn-glycerol-3-phosphate acyltransferase [Fibrella aquatilis]MBO0929619.1 1-acyl-sn-glycerol-3-phosphate acyltransferase [Fibrella aquatilis]